MCLAAFYGDLDFCKGDVELAVFHDKPVVRQGSAGVEVKVRGVTVRWHSQVVLPNHSHQYPIIFSIG